MADEDTDEDGEEAAKDFYGFVTGLTFWEGREGLVSDGMGDPRVVEEAGPSHLMVVVV